MNQKEIMTLPIKNCLILSNILDSFPDKNDRVYFEYDKLCQGTWQIDIVTDNDIPKEMIIYYSDIINIHYDSMSIKYSMFRLKNGQFFITNNYHFIKPIKETIKTTDNDFVFKFQNKSYVLHEFFYKNQLVGIKIYFDELPYNYNFNNDTFIQNKSNWRKARLK